jgi:hypothetical protein
LAALQEVLPVTFEARSAEQLRGLDGLLVFDPAGLEAAPVVPALMIPSQCGASRREPVEFSHSEHVQRPLRGRRLVESVAHESTDRLPSRADAILATVGRDAVWWRTQTGGSCAYFSAFGAEEIRLEQTLRGNLRAGCFMGLVPLLQFLGELCKELTWSERALQASFVIDDPNLHWPSYGYLRYADLIEHASRHSYHVGIAMVPRDGWLVSERAAKLVRENGERISLLVHGNDHVSRELGGLRTDRAAELAIGQALRRIASFERRARLTVGRVMAPPHGACSEPALRAMFRFGFDAACISRADPWRDRLPPWSPLAGWSPAELVGGGLPVLPRQAIGAPREDLIFRALLRQPLIVYGHHWDVAEGLDVLDQAAQEINRLGDVRWGPLETIASENYLSRREGELLVVQMHSRRARIDVPAGVTALRVQTPATLGDPLWSGLSYGRDQAVMRRSTVGWSSGPLDVAPCAELELALPPARPLDQRSLPEPPRKLWPPVRRGLVELRDRARPFVSRRAR